MTPHVTPTREQIIAAEKKSGSTAEEKIQLKRMLMGYPKKPAFSWSHSSKKRRHCVHQRTDETTCVKA